MIRRNILDGVARYHAGDGSVGIIGSGWWIMREEIIGITIAMPFVIVKPELTDRSVIKR